jgi:hypothetical protein
MVNPPGKRCVGGVVPTVARWSAIVVLCLMVTAGPGASVAGAAVNGVSVSAVVNGQPADSSSDARPAQLFPDAHAQVHITVANHTGSTVRISAVRFQGDVLDLPLFSYDTAIDLIIPPGETKALTFPVALNGVGSQATGLVATTVTLLGPNGGNIASQSLVANVHGTIRSIYGLFGLVVLFLTLSSLALALLSLARHTLSQNRWARGVRFLIPGFGVGLVLTFTLSVFRVFTPGPGRWLPLLIVPSVIGLALGFLTPAPNEEEFDDYDDDVLLAQIVVVDDDPLENGDGRLEDRYLVSVGSGAPDSRPTAPPSAGPAHAAPESRPTAPPNSRPTTAPPVGRPTAPPDSRPTAPPSAPDGRPTAPPPGPDGRPTAAP